MQRIFSIKNEPILISVQFLYFAVLLINMTEIKHFKKILIANRGEIAIRIARACSELSIQTMAIFTYEDRYSLHRYKADEAYQIGSNEDPLKPYLDIQEIIRLAKKHGADAIHPGYGFLSENKDFAQQCADHGIKFIGPSPSAMGALGDKVLGKQVAEKNNVPTIKSNTVRLTKENLKAEAERITYPLMLKASAGGGGRGMRIVHSEETIEKEFREAQSEAKNAFGNDEIFIEKYIANPKHIEVQIIADEHGNVMHAFERDCSIQRRHQKVVEIAPSFSIQDSTRQKLFQYATSICTSVNYSNVGTVEFLVDKDENIYFIEVNPRIQVEHTITEMVTGIDLVKLQILIAQGYALNQAPIQLSQENLKCNGYAIQCRITTEDPQNNFKPDYGTLITYRNAAGFGIRLDEGSTYPGMKISPFFDSLLVKVSAWSLSIPEAAMKMDRALREFRIRGVKNNIQFLENLINHPQFINGDTNVNFIQNHPELFEFKERLDRGTKVLKFLADTTINGNPDIKPGLKAPIIYDKAIVPEYKHLELKSGTKQILTDKGPQGLVEWIKQQQHLLYTDTTLRDAHQSLLATRMRTNDMLEITQSFAHHHPQTFSLECWGGATFDVCLRFLHEDPWMRLRKLREAAPNILLQMLIRGSNGVGYAAYPDRVIEAFVEQAWENGVDVFRIFDSLNWLQNMEPCIQFVRDKTNGIAEVSLCYTGDILNPKKTKYTLAYYLNLAKRIEASGAHILAIKDMAGLLKPYAAYELITALKSEINIPIHLHTHDTSGMQLATYLKAAEAGVDILDVAIGSMSGLTSQPGFNAMVELLKFQKQEQSFDIPSLNRFSNYWEAVRPYYYPFESGLQAPSAEVFTHEIPGGQYSNLKPQSRALGLGDQWEEIKEMYVKVNDMFGDIVKVTPSSKAVGDMALFMVANNLEPEDVLEKGMSLAFPDSVIALFKGEMGQPEGGFPKVLQKVILKDVEPYTKRPNEYVEDIDIDEDFQSFRNQFGFGVSFTDYLSYKMYPKVFQDAYEYFTKYGDVSVVHTKQFFYGMDENEEVLINISEGKSLLIRLLSVGKADENGNRTVFFKLNGQTRNIEIQDKSIKTQKVEHAKVDKSNPNQIGSPLQGLLSTIMVKQGDKVTKNQPLFVIEAMKMETIIAAPFDAEVSRIVLQMKDLVNTDDLIVELKAN
jgi:pyruvate carboxylase